MTSGFIAVSFSICVALQVLLPIDAARGQNYLNVKVINTPLPNEVITVSLIPRTVIRFGTERAGTPDEVIGQNGNLIYLFNNGGKIVFSRYDEALMRGTSAILLPELGKLAEINLLEEPASGGRDLILPANYPKTGVSTFDPKKIPNIQALARAYGDNTVLSQRLTNANRFRFNAFVLFKDNAFAHRAARLNVTRAYECCSIMHPI